MLFIQAAYPVLPTKKGMLIRLFFIHYFLINNVVLFAQEWVSPISQGYSNFIKESIQDCHFISDTQGWAVGPQGTILMTNNGGQSWTKQVSGNNQLLKSVHFVSPTQGWVAGNEGQILTTTNGGATWTIQTSSGGRLNSVYFVSPNQGYAVGENGRILSTFDGGITWSFQAFSNYTFNSVFFISANQGWIVGNNGIIYTTNDGGTTWTLQQYPRNYQNRSLHSVHFTSPTRGWAVGENGTVITTVNGGVTWTVQASGVDAPLYSVYFASQTKGWAVGSYGTIITTGDSGMTWTSQASGTISALRSVNFTSEMQGWALGDYGIILNTNNGGISWSKQVLSRYDMPNLSGLYFTSDLNGCIIGGEGTILTSDDGGIFWTKRPSGTTNALKSVFFASATHGWIVGSGGTILFTQDGGINWGVQTSGTSTNLNSVYFASPTQGWIAGNDGLILYTNNGGTTWVSQTSGTTEHLYSVRFTSEMKGWAVGDWGTILRTNDGGVSWTPQASGVTSRLNYVYFVSPMQGWIAGGLTTNDGGNTWVKNSSQALAEPYLFFPSATHGWTAGYSVGMGNDIWHTKDGGSNWSRQTSGIGSTHRFTPFSFAGLFFASNTKGWAIGNGGTDGPTILLYKVCTSPAIYNVTGGGTYCQGGSGVAIGLENSEVGVSYQLHNGVGNIGSPILGDGNALSFGNQTNAGNYTIKATRISDGCTATMSGSASVGIDAESRGGNTFGGATFCTSNNSTVLYLRDNNGSIIKWQSSTNNDFSNPTDISTNLPYLACTNIATTTYFRVVVKSGNCMAVNSNPVAIIIPPLPTATIAGSTTVCQYSPTPQITFTGFNGSAPYTFTYKINNGPNQTITTTNDSTTVLAPTNEVQTLIYTLISVQDANCIQNQSGTATITVVNNPPKPLKPDVINAQCDSDSNGTEPVTLTYSCPSGNPVWFINNNPASSIPNVTLNPNGNMTYIQPLGVTNYSYVCHSNNIPCQSPMSDIRSVNVINSLPIPISELNVLTICSGRSVSLSALGCIGEGVSIQWFRSSNNDPVPVVVTPNQTTDYYARCVYAIEGTIICSGEASMPVRIQVNSAGTSQLVLTQPITSGNVVQSASIIEATNQISGGNVEYRATQSIMLNPGFSSNNTTFKATVVGCD